MIRQAMCRDDVADWCDVQCKEQRIKNTALWHTRRAVGRRQRLLGTDSDKLLPIGYKGSQPAESGTTNAEVMMESVE